MKISKVNGLRCRLDMRLGLGYRQVHRKLRRNRRRHLLHGQISDGISGSNFDLHEAPSPSQAP